MNTIKLALVALFVGATGLGAISLWMAQPQNTTATFICPETQLRTTQMALKETTADVARYSVALGGPELDNAIRVIAADLKRRHPQADAADIVNYLLTAYCPLLKERSGLTDQEKRQMMDRFSAQAYALVH